VSRLSQQMQRISDKFRKREGTPVVFKGATYYVTTEEVSGAKAGEQGVPRAGLGANIAATSPRVFVFSATAFKPYTAVDPPVNGDIIVFHSWDYYVTHPDVEDTSTDTTSILIYALRQIGPLT